MREAYIDLARADIPEDWGTTGKVLSYLLPNSSRLGRQQVIWGESDQFRLMDVINPLDTTWHLQQEEWDKIRIPLWLIKGIWDIGDLGPISNAFTEVVWNPGDFQPGNKVEFLPAPWAVPIPNPVRGGQIQVADPNSPASALTPIFNLQGTSYPQGRFPPRPGRRERHRHPLPWRHRHSLRQHAGVRVHRQLPVRARPRHRRGGRIAVRLEDQQDQRQSRPNVLLQDGTAGRPTATNPAATFAGSPAIPANVTAEFIHPYTHIFGMTANWFEGNYTNTVFRMEMAYQLGAPFQSAYLKDRVNIDRFLPGPAGAARLHQARRVGRHGRVRPADLDQVAQPAHDLVPHRSVLLELRQRQLQAAARRHPHGVARFHTTRRRRAIRSSAGRRSRASASGTTARTPARSSARRRVAPATSPRTRARRARPGPASPTT